MKTPTRVRSGFCPVRSGFKILFMSGPVPVGFKNPCPVVYWQLCGYPPFFDENDANLFAQIMRGDYEFDSPFWDDISDSAKDLIKKYMTVNPKNRLSCAEGLKHPWIAGTDQNETNIHESVSGMMRKTLLKAKWKNAMNATMAVNRIRLMGMGARAPEGEASGAAEAAPAEES
eukprot:sb/3472087/